VCFESSLAKDSLCSYGGNTSVSTTTDCLNSLLKFGAPETRAEAEDAIKTIGKELEQAFQVWTFKDREPSNGDEEALRAKANLALNLLAEAWPDYSESEAQKPRVVAAQGQRKRLRPKGRMAVQKMMDLAMKNWGKGLSGRLENRKDAKATSFENMAGRRLEHLSFDHPVYDTNYPINSTHFVDNCYDDPQWTYIWGLSCNGAKFYSCEVNDYVAQTITSWNAMEDKHWLQLQLRCPNACDHCQPNGSSTEELLARCEDSPTLWAGIAGGMGCGDHGSPSTACSGYIDPSVNPWFATSNFTAKMTVRNCPRTCRFCEKCLPGMYVNPLGIGGNPTMPDYDPDFCQPCAAGKAQILADMPNCDDCLTGEYTANNGSSVCTQCPLGYYQGVTGQTFCHPCAPAGQPESAWTSRILNTDPSTGITTLIEATGAQSASACGCISGTTVVNNSGVISCQACTEGQYCSGMGVVPQLEDGYWANADNPWSVYKCEFPLYCQGTRNPGECTKGRDGNTLQCGECLDGYQPDDNGECKDCGDGGVVFFLFIVFCVVLCLCLLYAIIAMENKATQKTSTILVTIALGLFVTVAQQLKVFNLLAIDPPDPFKMLLESMTVFGFDLNVVGLSCVDRFEPVMKFAFNLINIVILLGVLALIHIAYAIKQGKGSHIHLLMNCYGTIFMAFATAISSLTFAPFQCIEHPNDKWTMKGYPTTVCWEGSDHAAMLVIGIVASLILFACCAVCIFIVRQFPVRMRRSDTAFLKGTSFLFARFRISSYFYGLICVFRGMLVALVPVLPNALTQCSLLIVLLFYCTATTYFLPWRVPIANCLDVSIQISLILTLTLALFFAEQPNLKLVSQFCCAIIGIAFSLIVIALGWGFGKKYCFKTKEFQFFLCHHKGGCGSFARLMKMHLLESSKVKAKVFLDSDDLVDLNKLFDFVRNDLMTLVVLCSKEVLMRPWCAGEMTTARLNNVPVRLVLFSDFSFPTQDVIKNYGTLCPGCATLTPHGIDEDMVQTTLGWISTNPTITFKSDVSMGAVDQLCNTIYGDQYAKGGPVSIEIDRKKTDGNKKAVILADLAYSEAASTAYVLEKLLIPYMHHNAELMPPVLGDKETLAASTTHVILICSRGCFNNPNLVRALLTANELKCAIIPVVSEEAFRFPTEPFFDSLRADGPSIMKAAGSDDDIELLCDIIRGIFCEIAVVLHAWNDSHVDLNVRAAVVAKRLLTGSSVSKSVSKMSVRSKTSQKSNSDENPVLEDQSI
jgi:hypothetical protein